MPKIFISYRRADSTTISGRIYDRLIAAFGKENVFKDVDNIPFGSDFRGVLAEAVSDCDVLLAVIGQKWLTVTDEGGNRRLDNPADFVRIEIETGLSRDRCLVIPVLVDNAAMPRADLMPINLRELTFKNATHVRDDPDFHPDVTRIIKSLESRFGSAPTQPSEQKPAPFDVHAAITRFYQAFEDRDWEAARAVLTEIRASGKAPRVFNVDQHERDIWAEIEGEERDKEYAVIRLMANRRNPTGAWEALQIFWQTYPDYDPDELGVKFKPAPPPPPKPKILSVTDILPAPFAWVEIPAGKVKLVNTWDKDENNYLKKNQPREFDVPAFSIAKYPVTNGQFQVFADAPDGYVNPAWWEYSPDAAAWRAANPKPQDRAFPADDHPRANITWYESVAFCRWLNVRINDVSSSPLRISLPTEQQWQRTAQGDTGWAYPWGDTWDGSRCNNSVSPKDSNSTASVTDYEGKSKDKGDSPFGVTDMSGNVWEWCLTEYKTGESELIGTNVRVVRGGSWGKNFTNNFRVDYRVRSDPNNRVFNWGFRCVRLI